MHVVWIVRVRFAVDELWVLVGCIWNGLVIGSSICFWICLHLICSKDIFEHHKMNLSHWHVNNILVGKKICCRLIWNWRSQVLVCICFCICFGRLLWDIFEANICCSYEEHTLSIRFGLNSIEIFNVWTSIIIVCVCVWVNVISPVVLVSLNLLFAFLSLIGFCSRLFEFLVSS